MPTGKGSLGEALRIVDGLAIQRSLVVVVSDFRGPIDWHQPLLRVAGRHPTVAVEIRDPREQELADVGELRLVDPETGRQLRVDTSSARLRERFKVAAAEEREGLVRLLSLGRRPPRRALDRGRLAPAARRLPQAERGRPMSFASPWLLLSLLLVPLAIGGYVLLERQRARAGRSAGRRAALMPNMVPSRPGFRRYVPLVLFLIALVLLLAGFARPQATIDVPREGATVVLAIDISGSMDAKDVNRPDGKGRTTRLLAARDAATEFLEELPDKYRVSLVTFGNRGIVQGGPDLRPRQDRRRAARRSR